MIIAGIVVLGNATIASLLSVVLVGWLTLFAGIAALVSAFLRRGEGGVWNNVIAGALLVVLGLTLLRHEAAGLVALTLVAGALFLLGGIVRLSIASQMPEYRLVLIISGVVSVVLGLMVFFNIFAASLILFGTLLGVEMISDGIALLMGGRLSRQVPSV